MLQFQQHLFRTFFFLSTNDVMCRLYYDVIYHPSRINSQYLKTWGVDRPALYRIGVHTTPDIFSCRHIVVNIVAPCKEI